MNKITFLLNAASFQNISSLKNQSLTNNNDGDIENIDNINKNIETKANNVSKPLIILCVVSLGISVVALLTSFNNTTPSPILDSLPSGTISPPSGPISVPLPSGPTSTPTLQTMNLAEFQKLSKIDEICINIENTHNNYIFNNILQINQNNSLNNINKLYSTDHFINMPFELKNIMNEVINYNKTKQDIGENTHKNNLLEKFRQIIYDPFKSHNKQININKTLDNMLFNLKTGENELNFHNLIHKNDVHSISEIFDKQKKSLSLSEFLQSYQKDTRSRFFVFDSDPDLFKSINRFLADDILYKYMPSEENLINILNNNENYVTLIKNGVRELNKTYTSIIDASNITTTIKENMKNIEGNDLALFNELLQIQSNNPGEFQNNSDTIKKFAYIKYIAMFNEYKTFISSIKDQLIKSRLNMLKTLSLDIDKKINTLLDNMKQIPNNIFATEKIATFVQSIREFINNDQNSDNDRVHIIHVTHEYIFTINMLIEKLISIV